VVTQRALRCIARTGEFGTIISGSTFLPVLHVVVLPCAIVVSMTCGSACLVNVSTDLTGVVLSTLLACAIGVSSIGNSSRLSSSDRGGEAVVICNVTVTLTDTLMIVSCIVRCPVLSIDHMTVRNSCLFIFVDVTADATRVVSIVSSSSNELVLLFSGNFSRSITSFRLICDTSAYSTCTLLPVLGIVVCCTSAGRNRCPHVAVRMSLCLASCIYYSADRTGVVSCTFLACAILMFTIGSLSLLKIAHVSVICDGTTSGRTHFIVVLFVSCLRPITKDVHMSGNSVSAGVTIAVRVSIFVHTKVQSSCISGISEVIGSQIFGMERTSSVRTRRIVVVGTDLDIRRARGVHMSGHSRSADVAIAVSVSIFVLRVKCPRIGSRPVRSDKAGVSQVTLRSITYTLVIVITICTYANH